MKVILSRKGFDSSYGGCASPILPDGTMLSMPIPGGEASNLKFEDIKYGEITYLDIWDKLYSKHKTDKLYCHLDPDIRADVFVQYLSDRKRQPNYQPASLSHLQIGDIEIGRAHV